MATIRIIAPGKIREKWLISGIAEYCKRLSRYIDIKIVEVDDTPDSWPVEKSLQEECKRIMSKIRPQDYCVLLDLQGSHTDSVSFAVQLQNWLEAGQSEVVFIIGGSNGLDPLLRERAQKSLCLSSMTFTHQMTRLLLLEQCYRAFRISRNEPYHK